jgi:3',5'-cyclic-AMP phosphodiesterase
MKILWLTDIHLEFLNTKTLRRFYRTLETTPADAALISGDIGQAPTTLEFLRQLHDAVQCPVYFVFGNHNFYYGAIDFVRYQAMQLNLTDHMQWLGNAGVVPLTRSTCCIGHDGWGDCRNGDYRGSKVLLNDFELINELAGLRPAARKQKLMRLGDEAAAHIQQVLPDALSAYRHIVVVTHVPPFPEATWWQGNQSTPDYLPFFSCKAMGEVLIQSMQKFPEKHMTVLCGHTHGSGTVAILPNLIVHTGSAEYGYPEIQKIFEWE